MEYGCLTKHIWDLVLEKQILWPTWVIKKKLKRSSFDGITMTVDCSWSWRHLIKLRSLVKSLFDYRLGDGRRFSFWFDPWCDGCSLVDLFPNIDLRD